MTLGQVKIRGKLKPPPKVMDSDQNSVNPEKIMEETLANFVKPYQSLKAPSSRHGARDIFVRRDI